MVHADPVEAVRELPRESNLDADNPKTEYGWDIFPAGFRTVLDEAKGYGLPIYVTENGIADSTDAQRPRFLVEHSYVLEQAIEDGVDVRGHMHPMLLVTLPPCPPATTCCPGGG